MKSFEYCSWSVFLLFVADVVIENGPKYLRNIFSSFFVFRQNDPNFWKKIEKMFRPKQNFVPRWPPRVTPAARPVPSRRWCKCSRAIKCLAGSHNVQRNLPRLISEKLCLTQRASMINSIQRHSVMWVGTMYRLKVCIVYLLLVGVCN